MRYRVLIGTGGIGSGAFFALDGNATLGREESRSGRFLDRRDYCKLHIIAHYVKALLGDACAVIPVGQVGADEVGARLLEEMAAVGLDLRYVRRAEGLPTMYALCYIYPDGSGGNLTTNDSACAHVDTAMVREAEVEFARFAGHGIALAAPEVPLAARRVVLELGTQYGFLRAASFTPGEMAGALDGGLLAMTDLLALNADEAAALALAGGVATGEQGDDDPMRVVEAAVGAAGQLNPAMWLTVTAGAGGSWSWDGTDLRHIPVLPVKVVGTSGAGDAHLAGTIAGLAAGMDLADAHALGALTAAMSVTSPHTINMEVNKETLHRFALQADVGNQEVLSFLGNA